VVATIEEIISNSTVDTRIEVILKKYPYPYISGRKFKHQSTFPPAFTIGFTAIGSSFGGIYISDTILDNFKEKELEWIILHEIAHIVNNHLGWKLIADYLSLLGAEFFAETLETSFSTGELIIKMIRAYVTMTSGGITKEFELAADRWASDYQQTTSHGISVLVKISEGDVDRVSHVSSGFSFEVPALTIRQRIEALQPVLYYRRIQ